MCLADSRLFLPGLNLAYTDRSSMAASCEVRVPFVDPLVFEAAFSLGENDRIRGRVQKAALKDVARHWLPDEIVDRPKASFGAPLRAWVNQDLSRARRRRAPRRRAGRERRAAPRSRSNAWSPTSEPGGGTTPSRYGSC